MPLSCLPSSVWAWEWRDGGGWWQCIRCSSGWPLFYSATAASSCLVPGVTSSTCHSLYHHKHGTQQSSVNQDKPISLKHIYKIIQFKKYSWRLHTVTSRRDIFGRFSKESCCLPLVSILNYMVNVSRPLDTALDRRGYLVICCGAHECCCCPHCKQVAVVLLWCCWMVATSPPKT